MRAPGGGVAEAQVVAVQEVVGGGVVQRRRGLAGDGEQAVDHEGNHHAAHVPQELGHRQHAARGIVRRAAGYRLKASSAGPDARGRAETSASHQDQRRRHGKIKQKFLLTRRNFRRLLPPPSERPKEAQDDGREAKWERSCRTLDAGG